MSTSTHWPLFDLVVTTPRLELRYVDDDLAAELMSRVVRRGIHDPAFMPFGVPWSRAESPLLERQGMQHFWRLRTETVGGHWVLPMAVIEADEPVGVQSLRADDFGALKTVETGSWLLQDVQGRGVGKEMRAAVLQLAFERLGAELATTSAFADNASSVGVTRSLGYRDNGFNVHNREGVATRQQRFVLTRQEWRRRDDIAVSGLEPCLPILLGTQPYKQHQQGDDEQALSPWGVLLGGRLRSECSGKVLAARVLGDDIEPPVDGVREQRKRAESPESLWVKRIPGWRSEATRPLASVMRASSTVQTMRGSA